MKKQEIFKQILSIVLAPGWRAVFAADKAGGGLEARIDPCAYFALVRETYIEPGYRYHHDRLPHDQDITEIIEFTELHMEVDNGYFGSPLGMYGFFRFLGPGEVWGGEEARKSMEVYFAEERRMERERAKAKKKEAA